MRLLAWLRRQFTDPERAGWAVGIAVAIAIGAAAAVVWVLVSLYTLQHSTNNLAKRIDRNTVTLKGEGKALAGDEVTLRQAVTTLQILVTQLSDQEAANTSEQEQLAAAVNGLEKDIQQICKANHAVCFPAPPIGPQGPTGPSPSSTTTTTTTTTTRPQPTTTSTIPPTTTTTRPRRRPPTTTTTVPLCIILRICE